MTCRLCTKDISRALSNKKGEWLCGKCWNKKETPTRLWIYESTINQKEMADWFISNQEQTPPLELSEADLYITVSLPD